MYSSARVRQWILAGGLVAWAAIIGSAVAAAAERAAAIATARNSITAGDLKRHVQVLADDSFEGREAGTRGAQGAATYLAREFERHRLKPVGGDGSYFQPFFGNCRNVLGVIEGSDPVLRNQYVVICAHYDHVGYGNRRNSNGPVGFIHNGADDNASGTAALLEAAEAIASLPTASRRSILFALWDSEENGLNGSKHWIRNPTVPIQALSLAINLDMVGRLRSDRLTIYGTRTSPGLRRLLSESNQGGALALDFDWAMKDDSDHHSFFAASVPVLMLHTGLHDDYHRPSDDADKVNADGLQQISRYVFNVTTAAADADRPQRFRPQSRNEASLARGSTDVALPPLPSRLGVRWAAGRDETEGVRLQSVTPGSAAHRAGLIPGDRILLFAGAPVKAAKFGALVLAADRRVAAEVQGPLDEAPRTVQLQLDGSPVRVGVAWRFDDAEPTVASLVRIVPGSPAEASGLRLFDRIYAVNGEHFRTSDELFKLLASDRPLTLLIERQGRLRTVELSPLKLASSAD